MEAKLVSQQMRNKNSHPIYRKKKSQNVRKSIAHLTKNKCLNSGTTRCKANAFLTSHQIKLVRQMSEDINERNEKKIKMWFTFHYYFIVWSLFEKSFFFLLFIINFVSRVSLLILPRCDRDITLSSFYQTSTRAPAFRRHLISTFAGSLCLSLFQMRFIT